MKITIQILTYTLFGFLILNLFSCDEDAFQQVVEIEIPEHEPKISLAMEINQGDDILSTFVSRSSSINEVIETPTLEDITVNVFKNNTLFAEMLFDSTSRKYLATVDSLPDDQASYRIEVESSVYGKASAEQVMPKLVSFKDLEYNEDGAIDSYGERVDEIVFNIEDPSDEENFYSIDVYSFFKYLGDDNLQIQHIYASSLDPLLEYGGGNGGLILSDDSFNGKDYRISLNLEKYFLQLEDKDEFVLYIELKNISRSNYLYKRSLEAYWNAYGNPFAEPVVVHNNIKNGYGIFRTSSTYGDEIKLK